MTKTQDGNVQRYLPTLKSLYQRMPNVQEACGCIFKYITTGSRNNRETSSEGVALKKISSIKHFLFAKEANESKCCCKGETCEYANSKIDKYDFFHALYNGDNNVPTCQVEPHIKKGYVLAHQPWRYYLQILWTPNNETLNVWTHLLPALYFLSLFSSFNQTVDLYHVWPLLFVIFGAFMVTFFSAFAHLFHSRSSFHHCCLFLFDFFGIAMYAFTSITAHFFACADLSYYQRIGSLNLVIFTALGVFGFFCCCKSQAGKLTSDNHRHMKVWSNAGGYLYGMLPIFSRFMWADNDPGMHLHLYQFLFFLLCPIAYASDIPQRFWPGKFDIFGHSHQIFHVFSVLGCYYDIIAVHNDVTSDRWTQLSSQKYFPSTEAMILATTLMTLCCCFIGLRYVKKFKKHFKSELDGMCGSRSRPDSASQGQDEKEKKQ